MIGRFEAHITFQFNHAQVVQAATFETSECRHGVPEGITCPEDACFGYGNTRPSVRKPPLADGWKYSEMMGDPVLDDKHLHRYCYLTRHGESFAKLLAEMNDLAHRLKYVKDIQCLRRKIEMDVYDERHA